MVPYLSGDWALLALRVVLGAIGIVHGLPKLKDVRGTGAWMGSVGFRPGVFWATVVGLAEFFGGVLILAGLYTQLAALVLAIQFAVIVLWKLARREKFVGGIELDLVILAGLIILIAFGPGGFALDFIYLGA